MVNPTSGVVGGTAHRPSGRSRTESFGTPAAPLSADNSMTTLAQSRLREAILWSVRWVAAGRPTPVAAESRAAMPASAGEKAQPTRKESWFEAPAEPRLGWWPRLMGTASGQHSMALFDQVVVSGTSFLTTILIGRSCGADELGVYSLGLSMLVSWACVQEALIALPYTIGWHRSVHEARSEYAGSVLVHQLLLSALAVVVLSIAAMLLGLAGTVPGLATVTGVLAAVMPFALLREFGRRFAFAHLHMTKALVLDLSVSAMQLAGLGLLAWYGALSATTSFAAVGGSCALTATVWLYLARGNFVIRGGLVRRTMQQSWGLGKWLFASQIALFVQGYISYWLLAWTVGTQATGVYAACMSVVLFSNPLILGLSNILAPRAALAFAQGGGAKLRRDVFRNTLLLGATMTLFCALVLIAGDDVMRLLYHGQQYEGHGHTVTVLALAMLASALGMPASSGLATVERPDAVFRTALFAVVLSVVLIWFAVAQWGLVGAAYGFLAGNVTASVGRWVAFLAIVPRRAMATGTTTSAFAMQHATSTAAQVRITDQGY
jgi:O-antigen/teichoic acid export membrane protein